jgi:NTP pyrophosphatase (non-canonical NTP hydrolase)
MSEPKVTAEQPIVPREEVIKFAKAMECELRCNEGKGGWKEEDVMWLLERLEEEVVELRQAVDRASSWRIAATVILAEAADVANFAMMIADVTRGLK